MPFNQETDPFLDASLPLADTPIDETVRSTVEEQGPQALWGTILNKVLGVDGKDFMGGAAYRINSDVVSWYEDGTTRAVNSPLFDSETSSQVRLQLDGERAEGDEGGLTDRLYTCQRAIVSIVANPGASRPKATFRKNELLPVKAAIYRGYEALSAPTDGSYEDPTKPPRTVEVEGITEESALKIMSATYRATQQMKPPRQR